MTELDRIIGIVKRCHPVAEGTLGTEKVMLIIDEVARLRARVAFLEATLAAVGVSLRQDSEASDLESAGNGRDVHPDVAAPDRKLDEQSRPGMPGTPER